MAACSFLPRGRFAHQMQGTALSDMFTQMSSNPATETGDTLREDFDCYSLGMQSLQWREFRLLTSAVSAMSAMSAMSASKVPTCRLSMRPSSRSKSFGSRRDGTNISCNRTTWYNVIQRVQSTPKDTIRMKVFGPGFWPKYTRLTDGTAFAIFDLV